MNVLEKILEEIEHESKLAHEEMRRCASKNPLQFDEVKGYARGVEYAVDIIRSHMNEAKDINVPSKDEIEPVSEEFLKDCAETAARYKRNFDNWIPVEERLPNKNGVYNVTRLVNDAFISDSAYFDGQDTWHNDNRVNHTRPYLTDIVAWQPLPEPYRQKEQKSAKNTQLHISGNR